MGRDGRAGRGLSRGLAAALFWCAGASWAQTDTGAVGVDAEPPAGAAAQNDSTGAGGDTETPAEKKFTVGVQLGGKAQVGRGFALTEDGRSRLHLSLAGGAGFDTNPYSVPNEVNTFAGDLVVRMRPGATITYPGSLVSFDGGVYIDYGFLPGIIDASTRNLLLYQTSLGADLQINRGGMFTFALGDTVSWNSDPGQVVIGSVFNRIHNQLRTGVGYRPGGGTLQLKLTYAMDFIKWLDFDALPPGPIAAGTFDQLLHTASVRGDYRFLPKTGAFAQLSVGYNSFPFAPEQQPTAFPIGILFGVMGQLTPKLTGLASLGYGNPMVFDDQPSGRYELQTATYIGVMGQAELRWRITNTTNLGGGLQRTVNPAPLYQYVTNDRIYLAFAQSIADRAALGIHLGYSILEFGSEQPLGGSALTDAVNGRLDGHLDSRLTLTYNVFEWFAIGVSNVTDWRITNADTVDSGGEPINLGFVRNQTLFTLALSY